MPRTNVTKTNAPGSFPSAGVAVIFSAADVASKNEFVLTGAEIIVARNTGAGAATVTINSVANARGRTKDIVADSIAAGAFHVYGPFRSLDGWRQSGGKLHFEASSADIGFAVINLPRP